MAVKKRAAHKKRRPAHTRRQRVIPQDKEILNAQEVALVLGISERLVLRLARDGEIPARKLGREWRFLRSALRNALGGNGENSLEKALSKAGVKFTKR